MKCWYMKYLGIDVGSKTVGISVSDDDGVIAFPLEEVSRDRCVERITSLVAERHIDTLVIGESRALDGGENPIMEDIRAVAESLCGLVQVVFQPEQFSTQAAARLGKGSDAEAATIILQSYLDRSGVSDLPVV